MPLLTMPKALSKSFTTPRENSHPDVAPQKKFDESHALVKPTLVATNITPSHDSPRKIRKEPKSKADEQKAPCKKRLPMDVSSSKEHKKGSSEVHALVRPLLPIPKQRSSHKTHPKGSKGPLKKRSVTNER